MNDYEFLSWFERLVQEERKKYLRKIDKELRQTFKDIPVRVLLNDKKSSLYGDYSGTAYPEKHPFAPYSYPSDITIYARGFEEFAHDEKLLREKIRLVLMHEYGHYLGFSEEELRKRGM